VSPITPRALSPSIWTWFGMIYLAPTSTSHSTNTSLSSSLLSTPSRSSHLELSSYPFYHGRSRTSSPPTSDSEHSYPHNDGSYSSEDEDEDDEDDSLTLFQRLAKVQRACTKRKLQTHRTISSPSTTSTKFNSSAPSGSISISTKNKKPTPSYPKLIVLHVSAKSESDSWEHELSSVNHEYSSSEGEVIGKRKRRMNMSRNRFGQLKRRVGEGFWEWVARTGA